MTTTTIRRNHVSSPSLSPQAQGPQEELPLRRLPAPVTAFAGLGVFSIAGAIVFGDAAAAAVVAGVFSVVNFLLNARLTLRMDRQHRELSGPRRILHDDDGKAIASVIAHDADPADNTPRRRIVDHMNRRRTD
jgi:hypothetical protein